MPSVSCICHNGEPQINVTSPLYGSQSQQRLASEHHHLQPTMQIVQPEAATAVIIIKVATMRNLKYAANAKMTCIKMCLQDAKLQDE